MAHSVTSLLFLVVALYMMRRCEGIDVTIQPSHVHVSQKRNHVSVTCKTGHALSACQFTWWNTLERSVGPLLDLGLGAASQVDPDHLHTGLRHYRYSGRGLDQGDCGVRLTIRGVKYWVISCRVKEGEDAAWSYQWTDLLAYGADRFSNVTVEQEQVVALPGSEASFLVRMQERLGTCVFNVPNGRLRTISFNSGSRSRHSSGRHLYRGAGLEAGECGLTLYNITVEDNGPVTSFVMSLNGSKVDVQHMPLIVARPPSEPRLSVHFKDGYANALCIVAEGCPAANITWKVGNRILRQGAATDLLGLDRELWAWPWSSRPVAQILNYKMERSTFGQSLVCEVTHMALARALEASVVLAG